MGNGQSDQRYHHDKPKAFRGRELNGDWYVLAKCPSDCDYPSDRELVTFQYDCSQEKFEIEARYYCKGALTTSRRSTAVVKEFLMPAQLESKALDNLPSNGVNGCHYVHYVDECYAIVAGHGENKLWVLTRQEKVTREEVGHVLDCLRQHGLNCSCLVSSCDFIKEEECEKTC